MPMRPPPFTLSCPQCRWHCTVVPKSDALLPGEWPQHCPHCRHGPLHKRAATWLETLAAKLPGKSR